MTTTDTKNPIIDKIRKLMNLRDRAGSEAEAVNAATRIQEILTKHNLEMNVLDDPTQHEGVESEASEDTSIGFTFTSRLNVYDVVLAGAAAKLTDTMFFLRKVYKREPNGRLVYTRTSKGLTPQFIQKIVFVGLAANVTSALETLKYFQTCSHWFLDSRWRKGQVKGNAECRSYRLGVAHRISSLVHQFKSDQEFAQHEQGVQGSIEGAQCTALVVLGTKVAQSYMDTVVKPKGEYKTNHQVSDFCAYSLGRKDGSTVDVNGAGRKRVTA